MGVGEAILPLGARDVPWPPSHDEGREQLVIVEQKAREAASMCALTRMFTVSEGGLEPVERPLDKRVSDILSAKMDPGGPGCTPLLRIGALQERTKVAPDNDPGTKSGPGMSDPGPLVMGVELGYESVDPDCGAWIDKALRWRGPDNAKVRSSVFRPSELDR